MKNLLLTITTVFAITTQARADCLLGYSHDQAVIKAALEQVVKNGDIQIDAFVGMLTLSVSPVDVITTNSQSTEAHVTITRTYHNMRDAYGPLQEKSEFRTRTTAATTTNCKPQIINERKTGHHFAVKRTPEAGLLQIAFEDMMTANDFVPASRHSGSMTLRFPLPSSCEKDRKKAAAVYNLNIQRQHQASGIVSRVSTYLVDETSQTIVARQEAWGRFLRNICRE